MCVFLLISDIRCTILVQIRFYHLVSSGLMEPYLKRGPMFVRSPVFLTFLILALLIFTTIPLITCKQIETKGTSHTKPAEPSNTIDPISTPEKEAVKFRPSPVKHRSPPGAEPKINQELVDPLPLVPLMVKRVFPDIVYNLSLIHI